MSLKTHYSNEAEIPAELKNFYVFKNGRFELQVEGFESVPNVLAHNSELTETIKKHTAKISDLEAKATQVNSLTQDLANKNAEISRLSTDLTKAQSTTLPAGYVAIAKKEADILQKIKEKNVEVDKLSEILTNFETVQKENANFKLEKSIVEFAATEKVQNVKALTRLIIQDGVMPVIKEVEENGAKVSKGFLVKTLADNQTEEKTYEDYKKVNWSEFLPALEQQQQRQNGNTIDPPPFSAPTDAEAAKVAQQAQAWVTHNGF
jgi:hypothetical protein